MKTIKPENVTLTNTEKVMLLSNFATMLSAGISILEAVDSLSEDAKGHYKFVLDSLRKDLVQGKRVYIAFSKFPGVFDKVTVNIIRAAEEAGILDRVLHDLKDNLRKQIEFMDKIKFALLYPVIVIVVFFAIFFMILTFVIPKLSSVFTQLKVKIPLPTRILFFMSDIIVKHPLAFGLSTAVILLLILLLYIKRKKQFINFLISLPLIRNLIRQIDLTRFSYNLHLLLNSGITINTSLELCEEMVIREDIAHVINKSRQMVMSGRKFSSGLKTSKHLVPSMMIKLIEAGENSGTLVRAMKDISEYLDYEVVNTLKALTALLEPIMLVAVGLVIGGMMIAIITPIYSLISQIGVR